jgi:hypothetical protein
MEGRGQRGPAGLGSHPELAGEVNGAEGGLAAAQSTAASLVDCGETVTAAVTPGTSDQFLQRGGCWRRGGPAGHLGGARGGTEWRRQAASMAAARARVWRCSAGEREQVRERKRRRGFVASEGVSSRSSRWPGRKQEVASAMVLRRARSCLGRRPRKNCKKPPSFGVFSKEL